MALASTTTSLAPPAAPRPQILTAEAILTRYPILRRIAACESTGSVDGTPRQFRDDGSPLWGNDVKTGKPIHRDVGIFQINTKAHADEISKLGLDVINNEDDNANYALMLYERNGTRDWDASKMCWSML